MIDWSLLGSVQPTQPQQLQLPSPSDVTLDQTEWVQHSELANLANRLVKNKSEHHQRIGRTLAKMLRGELYSAPEPKARNQILYQVAGEILEAFPYCAPDSVVELLQVSIERMREETDSKWPGNPAPTLAEFRSMLVRHQGPKQGKHATITEAMAAIDAAKKQVPGTEPLPAFAQADSWGLAVEGTTAAPTGPTAAELAGLDRRSLIVRVSDSLYFMRHPAAVEYNLKASSQQGVRIHLQRYYVDAGLALDLVDDDGEMYAHDKIARNYAMNAKDVVYDYTVASTTFNQQSALLRVGITMGRLPDQTVIEPQHSDAVELWLYTLVGGEDKALIDLYDWIASTDQRHAHHPAVAVALQGPPSVGKTQFARGLAMTWGSTEPVPFKYVLDRFNGALLRCPIWFADEQLPEGLNQATLRTLVQETERGIELKGQERVLLAGCARIVLAVNDLRDLHINATGASIDAIDATASRIAIYETLPERTCVQALLAIADGDRHKETLAIAQHLRAIQVTETPRHQRFYGSRSRERAKRQLLYSSVMHSPLCADALVEYATNPISWERSYNDNAPSELGVQWPILVRDGELWICAQQLTCKIGLRHFEIRDINKSLEPFVLERKRLSRGSGEARTRGYYSRVDHVSLAQALGVDFGPLMSKSTEQRRLEIGINDA